MEKLPPQMMLEKISSAVESQAKYLAGFGQDYGNANELRKIWKEVKGWAIAHLNSKRESFEDLD